MLKKCISLPLMLVVILMGSSPIMVSAGLPEPTASSRAEGGAAQLESQAAQPLNDLDVLLLWSLKSKKPTTTNQFVCSFLQDRYMAWFRVWSKKFGPKDGEPPNCDTDEFRKRDAIAGGRVALEQYVATLRGAGQHLVSGTWAAGEYDFERQGFPIAIGREYFPRSSAYLMDYCPVIRLGNWDAIRFLQVPPTEARALTEAWKGMPAREFLVELTIEILAPIETKATQGRVATQGVSANIVRAKFTAIVGFNPGTGQYQLIPVSEFNVTSKASVPKAAGKPNR
jgi:hypothetical protein